MRGRDSLAGHALWRWADEGVTWLNEKFKGKGFEFWTQVDTEKREVLFRIYKKSRKHPEPILEVVEPIESFVSMTTLTKIILIAG